MGIRTPDLLHAMQMAFSPSNHVVFRVHGLRR
jgi:hypothetical protein